jgi:hypothetical protein
VVWPPYSRKKKKEKEKEKKKKEKKELFGHPKGQSPSFFFFLPGDGRTPIRSPQTSQGSGSTTSLLLLL